MKYKNKVRHFALKTAAFSAAILISTICQSGSGQALPDSVNELSPGANGGFGAAFYPENVLGAPCGTVDPAVPTFSQRHLYSLGTGGSIVLEFSTNRIVDLPGPDFTVFENPVQPSGHPEQTFADTAVVAVSDDGTNWFTFPFDMISSAPAQLILKSNYVGLAGVKPSHSSTDNEISPFDPAVSGGDQYDLATVGLPHARFVRITDSGDVRHMPSYDLQHDEVYDYGNIIDPDPTQPDNGIAAGFDLDAVAAIHSEPYNATSIGDWPAYD